MNLVEEYKRQFGWRPWKRIFDALPPLVGKIVLDLGCGIGDQARELSARGASVIGFDSNRELIAEATSRNLKNCEFHRCDLRFLPNVGTRADGVWCSFTAAYFIDLPVLLKSWSNHLVREGWIALTEIDDLFGHQPLSTKTSSLLQAYTQDAMSAGRYDFRMGGKLQQYLQQSGYIISRVLISPDDELSFNGPGKPDVISAWQDRFERMSPLRTFVGSEFAELKQEFLACLSRTDHISTAKVISCFATKHH
jgi:ubiquinone/menaquinone biosynthesis C-methylase UbiE